MGTDKLWKKKWIEPGVKVVHILQTNHPERLSKIKMIVDKVVTRRVSLKDENGEKYTRNFVDGVRCYWFDDHGEYRTANFMTNDLVPYYIAVQGVEVINQWLNRFKENSDG